MRTPQAGASASRRVPVSGIHDNPIRAFAYMNTEGADRLGLGGVANQLAVVPAAGANRDAVQRRLFGSADVASVRPASDSAEALKRTVDSFSGAIQMVVVVSLGLGLLVAFTSASVSVDERRREYATMFAFGLPPRSGLRVAFVEALTTGVVGTLLGLVLGTAFAGWIVAVLLSKTFPDLGLEPTLSAASVAVTLIVGIGAVSLAPLLTWRRLRRMDIPSTLRMME